MRNYLNRTAFERPVPGTYGNHVANSIRGPGFWQVDLALSKLVSFGTAQTLEFRVEALNLFDTFNRGNPVTNFLSEQFGRINSREGDPRIMQFGLKYGF